MRRSARSRGRWRAAGGLALAGTALAAPALVHALIQRRIRAPDAAGWGRTRRYSGHLGPVVFQELGDGPPIVLLHAFGPGYDSRQWRAAAEALAPHFRILAPDLPGWGRSAALEPRPEIYLASLADFLTAVVREPAVLGAAGHAAPYAVLLAAELPDQVRALALAAPAGLPLGLDGHTDPLVAHLLGVPLLRISVLDALTSRAVLGHYLRSHAYAAPERVDAALLEHHYRVSHLPAHREALAAYWRGKLDLSAGADLGRLRVPVWIGWGAAGPEHEPGPQAGELSLLPAGSRIDVLQGSRALPHAEQPVAFSRALARFLGQLPPKS
jgi:pimeloyl-ACP methyl ester carboxylesterase